ncbi:MAG TPA: acyl-CoA thioester hydrolase/BAAT C-terminal domain-containing protein [Anaerolineaceae bacterium]|nr:acyl-CoA thioester hydrolase/BAAT C-terminal domain-containing protein [Anaerolineaceae bacterium]
MKLTIHPIKALCDQQVDIGISEMPANSKVKLSACLRLPWAKDVLFASEAWFSADGDGRVDLSRQKPDCGSYDFVDSMGLIESVMSQDPKAMEKISQKITLDESLFIDVTAECGTERASLRLERFLKAPEVRSQRIMDEFVGEFFYSDDPQNKTIVWLGGSGSNLAINALVCAPLASHGFNVLSVPFFGEKGLPAQLSRVPLEYFEKVFAWLKKNPLTAGKEIQVLGMSRGAEAALILASRHPEIKRAVLWAPHAYCFNGIAYKNESSWTYGGKDLPYIRLKNRWVFGSMLSCMVKNEPFRFTSVYLKGLAAAKNKEAARIKVEEAQADLLLIAGKDCGMWNTYDGCLEIMDILLKCSYPHAYDLIAYEDAGEPYLVPYVIPVGINSVRLAPRLSLTTGGTLQGNARARVDAWRKAIEFLGPARLN